MESSLSESGQRRGFVELEHTADRAVEAWGATLPELFVAAAEAMFSVSQKLSQIEREQEWLVELGADSREDLLHAWLAELLWVSERDTAVPCGFEVERLDEARSATEGEGVGRPSAAGDAAHGGAGEGGDVPRVAGVAGGGGVAGACGVRCVRGNGWTA